MDEMYPHLIKISEKNIKEINKNIERLNNMLSQKDLTEKERKDIEKLIKKMEKERLEFNKLIKEFKERMKD